jgi:uncharacterized protein YcaQ
VENGDLDTVRVEGWTEPGYVPAGTELARRPRRHHGTLLSPFDSLIWDRNRTLRLFGFDYRIEDYRIEVYVPEPARRYGYYVLPLLLGDNLVGRFDLKADRKASVLRVQGAWLELGADGAVVAEAAAVELRALAQWRNLDGVHVASRGNLAASLRRAVQTGPA